MMRNEVLGTIAVIISTLVVLAFIVYQGEANNKYDDTIAEYMMCIEYNPDCECSDIILSEYGDEVE